MTVQILRLSGLEVAEAKAAANNLLDIRTGPRDLRNLLVVDDTARLAEHESVYVNLDTAGRVEEMLCVAVGPRAGQGRKLRLPANLGGTQGSPVMWVIDPVGIDCRVAVAAVAIGHVPGHVDGLDMLIEILSAEEMFKRVHRAFLDQVPHRIANPGMRLAGQDDEAVTFATALMLAIRMLCGAGPGADGPFRELLPSDVYDASLAENGLLARYRDEVIAALDGVGKRAGLASRFHPGQASLSARLVEAGAALADLRDLVTELLRTAHTVGELNERQRKSVADAGVDFPTAPLSAPSARVAAVAAEQPPIYRTVVKAVQGGDTLPLVSKRLTLTERELKHRGSGSYLSEVDERCPQPLLDRLGKPSTRPARRGAPDRRPDQDLRQAVQAAKDLEDLVLNVASHEWSLAVPARAEVGRIRATLDGAGKALTEYADNAGPAAKARRASTARLAEILTPVVRDLIFHVVRAEMAQPSATGLEALSGAQGRTSQLLAEWVASAQAEGISSAPPFPSSGVPATALRVGSSDITEIRDTLLYQPAGEMWQLCNPDDLKNMLNLGLAPVAVRFASRMNKDALTSILSGDQPVWTSSGSNAGLLRLVSLRPEYVSSGWSEPEADSSSSAVAGSSAAGSP